MLKKKMSFGLLLVITCALLFPVQAAFAATQTLEATGTWRSLTTTEEDTFKIYESGGYAADSSTNPDRASEASPGWTANDIGVIRDPDVNIFRTAIMLELPLVDLSCSSNVSITIAGEAVQTLGGGGLSGQRRSGLIVNAFNEPLVYGGDMLEFSGDATSGDTLDFENDIPVSPYSTAFGLKVLLSVEVGTEDDPQAWDIHDMAVAYTYDDESGTCSPTAAPQQTTSCSDDYLSSVGQALDDDALAYFEGTWSGQINNVTDTPDDIRSLTGYQFNPNADAEVDSSSILELDITPQDVLLDAGTVQLQVDYDFVHKPGTDFAILAASINSADGIENEWDAVAYTYATDTFTTGTTVTAYMPSEELENARIVFMVFTGQSGEQLQSTLSNVRVSVRHLHDVAVCGIQLTNSNTPDVTTPTTTPDNSAVAAAAGALPATGSASHEVLSLSLILLCLGTAISMISKYKSLLG